MDETPAGFAPAPETPLEQALLGGARRHRRQETTALSGLDEETGRRLWRALGFPDVDDDTVLFTDGDVQALRDVRTLAEHQGVPIETSVTIARTMAQAASRLAQTEVAAMTEVMAQRTQDGRITDLDDLREAIVRDSREVVDVLERLLVHVWRRHLAAAAGRTFAVLEGGDASAAGRATLAVGFVDLVGFTSLSRRAHRGRARRRWSTGSRARPPTGSPRPAGGWSRPSATRCCSPTRTRRPRWASASTRAALHHDDDELPDVRAGVAFGSVLLRHGDVYGSTVNLASRLTSSARPGTVLADRGLHDALAADERFGWRALAARKVRGYDHLAPWVVRRADSRA